MSVNVLDREGSFKTSPVYFAYIILKMFKKSKKNEESVFRIINLVKQGHPDADAKQLFYGLIFLNMNGIIELDNGIVRVVDEH